MKLKKLLLEAIIGFALWTGVLTPYVLVVTQMTLNQYLSWLVMQAIIVPPVAIIVLRVTNYVTKQFASYDKSGEDKK
jgi:hypothetical protein